MKSSRTEKTGTPAGVRPRNCASKSSPAAWSKSMIGTGGMNENIWRVWVQYGMSCSPATLLVGRGFLVCVGGGGGGAVTTGVGDGVSGAIVTTTGVGDAVGNAWGDRWHAAMTITSRTATTLQALIPSSVR